MKKSVLLRIWSGIVLCGAIAQVSAQESTENNQSFFGWIKRAVGNVVQSSFDMINPNKDRVASVRQGGELSHDEQSFRTERLPVVKQGMETFLGVQLSDATLPPVAIAGSGGGYRAMILTLGYLQAAQDLGLLDASMYVASLSGSSWLLGTWMSRGGSLEELQDYFLQLIEQNRFNLMNVQKLLDVQKLINDVMLPKYGSGQKIASTDIFGGLLGQVLLGDTSGTSTLSDQWNGIKDGKKPFPLYTAVSLHEEHDTKRYHWYEFNPLEVRNVEYDLAIPAYAINWKFAQGVSVKPAFAEPFACLLGMFGSAYTASFKDLNRILKKWLEVHYAHKPMYGALLGTLAQSAQWGDVRLSPATLNNPFYQLQSTSRVQQWLSKRPYLTMVDAGISYNIPCKPLLYGPRGVKMIVVVDSSFTLLEDETSLDAALEDIQTYYQQQYNREIAYSRVDDGKSTMIRIYKDLNNDDVPRVVYLTFIKDSAVMEHAEQDPAMRLLLDRYALRTFDPEACVKRGFCNTVNFNYSKNQFLQLYGMAYFALSAHAQTIRNFMKKEFFS